MINKTLPLIALILFFSGASQATLITSSADAALSGATIDGFSSYTLGNTTSVSDGIFTMTQNGGGDLEVTDAYSGAYGAIGRSVVSWGRTGIEISFANTMSAFGIHIGGSDANWSIEAEAFSSGGVSLGSATVTHNVNGFFLGWADLNIGSVILSPTSSDAVLFDNLHYVEASSVPEPSVLLLLSLGLVGAGLARRKT